MNGARSHQPRGVNSQVRKLTPREAYEECTRGAVVLDVREEYLSQFKMFDVPEVIQIPLSRLDQDFGRLALDRLIIVADSSGLRSNDAISLLTDKGFTVLAALAGGLVEWERDGLPLVTEKSQRLSGSCACQLRARENGGAISPEEKKE